MQRWLTSGWKNDDMLECQCTMQGNVLRTNKTRAVAATLKTAVRQDKTASFWHGHRMMKVFALKFLVIEVLG